MHHSRLDRVATSEAIEVWLLAAPPSAAGAVGPVHTGTGPTAAVGQAANPNLGVSIIRQKRLRRGLFGLPSWFFDCGRRSAARKATNLDPMHENSAFPTGQEPMTWQSRTT
jgi:hypothetical protein